MGPNIYTPQITSTTDNKLEYANATNASVTDTAASTKVTADSILIAAWAQPILVRWAVSATSAVDSTTGFYIPANTIVAMRKPGRCTHLQYLRAAGTNSNISILPIEGP